MLRLLKKILSSEYLIFFLICIAFLGIAFASDSPQEIFHGLIRITTSRSVLITDYTEFAGLGAAFVNSAVMTMYMLYLLISHKRKLTGRIIAALFLTMGFSLFGKNIFNALPMMIGVRLYCKLYKQDFSTQITHVMLSATISPVISEIAFYGGSTSVVKIAGSFAVGIFIGLIFPIVSETVKRVHNNYCLYNGGIAGGFIATFCVGIMRSLGHEISSEDYWGTGNTMFLATFIYILAASVVIYGFITEKRIGTKVFATYRQLLREHNPDNSDYYSKYGNICYVNIGIMAIVATTLMLVLGIPINGPTFGGILTISGFAAAGKHIKNTAPILVGSVIASYFNFFGVNYAMNALSILFSTGLAPMSGKYGWRWGLIIGFAHVSVALFIGQLNGGLNLYNNGFAGGFVAITVSPIIIFSRHVYADISKKFRKKL